MHLWIILILYWNILYKASVSAWHVTHHSVPEGDQGAALASGSHTVQWTKTYHLRGQSWELEDDLKMYFGGFYQFQASQDPPQPVEAAQRMFQPKRPRIWEQLHYWQSETQLKWMNSKYFRFRELRVERASKGRAKRSELGRWRLRAQNKFYLEDRR